MGPCARRDCGGPEGTHRGHSAQEHLPGGGLGPAVAQVVDQRLTDRRRQREGGVVARLALGDAEALPLPIDVVQPEGGDLPAAQPVAHQQHQDGVIPPAAGCAAVDAGQHLGHLGPRDGPRDR